MAREAGCWTEEDIGEMKEELRDQFYEKLEYGNRVLPTLPTDDCQRNSTVVEPNVREAAKIRSQLKEWTYKKLDYILTPLPAEPIPMDYAQRDLWLERDDSGLRLRYVDAPRYID
ncbi:hypothetical protein ACLMJK_006586 [Lecanora helva]